jgi:hypothetical protein
MWHAPAIYSALIERGGCPFGILKVGFAIAYNLEQLGRREIEDYRNEPSITKSHCLTRTRQIRTDRREMYPARNFWVAPFPDNNHWSRGECLAQP